MNLRERIGLPLLRTLDPERAHGLAIRAVQMGFGPNIGPITSASLATSIAGLDLPNPIGLAAGFDKNAKAIARLARAGFGFLEVGAATPKPQAGNPRPRLFRLTEDQAVINRFGFNNEGMDAIASRLEVRASEIPVGLNLGANKDSADRANDYAKVLKRCGAALDFATVNVSSPNTEGLRDLQGKDALIGLLANVLETRDALVRPIPVFVKIAPDLSETQLADVADIALATGIDGIVATNTTLDRSGLLSPHAAEMGGLSGAPLFERSTRVLAQLSALTEGQVPLIGVGGVGSAADAYAKIRAGAAAVQLYSALVYKGLTLVAEIANGLETLLHRDGFETVAKAVGTGRNDWL